MEHRVTGHVVRVERGYVVAGYAYQIVAAAASVFVQSTYVHVSVSPDKH